MKAETKKKSDRGVHWEQIYVTKGLKEASWYQEVPEISLELIEACELVPDAGIIDIGGGDSLLADYLLDSGYRDLTVVDISETALNNAKERLGDQADQVIWLVADAANFYPPRSYDLWHDRAAFHFLTNEDEALRYVYTAQCYLNEGGHLIIGTFSEEGPHSCSGLPVKQYSETSLSSIFEKFFEKIKCVYVDHTTPTGDKQNFVFCLFKKR